MYKITFQIEGATPVIMEANEGDNLLELAFRAWMAGRRILAMAFTARSPTLIEPILPMDLYMKKPWEITTCEEEHLLWPEP